MRSIIKYYVNLGPKIISIMKKIIIPRKFLKGAWYSLKEVVLHIFCGVKSNFTGNNIILVHISNVGMFYNTIYIFNFVFVVIVFEVPIIINVENMR